MSRFKGTNKSYWPGSRPLESLSHNMQTVLGRQEEAGVGGGGGGHGPRRS